MVLNVFCALLFSPLFFFHVINFYLQGLLGKPLLNIPFHSCLKQKTVFYLKTLRIEVRRLVIRVRVLQLLKRV